MEGIMSSKGILGFVAGTVIGAAIGAVAGILIAPRPGEETRGMVGDAATDAWGNVRSAYERGAQRMNEEMNDFCPTVDARSDELREKVDQARARMDQIRSSLSESASNRLKPDMLRPLPLPFPSSDTEIRIVGL